MEWNGHKNGKVCSVLRSVLFPFAIRSLSVYQNERSVPFCKTGIFLVSTVCAKMWVHSMCPFCMFSIAGYSKCCIHIAGYTGGTNLVY